MCSCYCIWLSFFFWVCVFWYCVCLCMTLSCLCLCLCARLYVCLMAEECIFVRLACEWQTHQPTFQPSSQARPWPIKNSPLLHHIKHGSRIQQQLRRTFPAIFSALQGHKKLSPTACIADWRVHIKLESVIAWALKYLHQSAWSMPMTNFPPETSFLTNTPHH